MTLPDPANPKPGDVFDFGSHGPLRGRIVCVLGVHWLDGPDTGRTTAHPPAWVARYGRVPDIDVAVAAFADEIPDYFDTDPNDPP